MTSSASELKRLLLLVASLAVCPPAECYSLRPPHAAWCCPSSSASFPFPSRGNGPPHAVIHIHVSYLYNFSVTVSWY